MDRVARGDAGVHHTSVVADQQPIVEHGCHAMIGAVDSISFTYSGSPPIMPLKEILDSWFPDLLGKTRRMQKNQREVSITPFIWELHRTVVMMHKVALCCNVIWERRGRRADDRLYEHRREEGWWSRRGGNTKGIFRGSNQRFSAGLTRPLGYPEIRASPMGQVQDIRLPRGVAVFCKPRSASNWNQNR